MPLDDFPSEDGLIVEVIQGEGELTDKTCSMDDVFRRMKEAKLAGVAVIGFDAEGNYYIDGNLKRYESYYLAGKLQEFLRK